MQDYNDDNYENEDEDDLFGTHRLQQELDKEMFLQECKRGFPLVLDPTEYESIFGTLTEEDKETLTQVFFSHYHRLGVTVDTLVDNWGLDWIWVILKDKVMILKLLRRTSLYLYLTTLIMTCLVAFPMKLSQNLKK